MVLKLGICQTRDYLSTCILTVHVYDYVYDYAALAGLVSTGLTYSYNLKVVNGGEGSTGTVLLCTSERMKGIALRGLLIP